MPATIHTLIETITLLTGSDGDSEERWTWRILQLLTDVLGADGALLLLPGGGHWERLAVRAGPPPASSRGGAPGPWFERRSMIGPPQGLLARVLAGETRLELQGEAPSEWDAVEGVAQSSLTGAVLNLSGRDPGLLAAWNPRSPDLRLLLTAAAGALGAALSNRELVRRLETEAVTDDLTGIYNYRHLRQALAQEIKRAGRYHLPLAVLMIDVDNLKEYNGRFGHLNGSQVLKQMAALFRLGIRDTDLVAKYGGDEFVVLLPHSTREGAAVVADRMRQMVAEAAFPHVAAGEITCSIGIAVFPEDATQPMALVAAADRLLFAAKGAGKNRIAA